jgi:glycosyltransferase involved in cell wall biosynthesis
VDEARVRCVHLGVDPEQFRPAEAASRAAVRRELGWPGDRPQALFVGALGDERKGLDLLIDAWTRLAAGRARFDADLNVVGRGRQLAHWRDLVSARNLGERVRFLGFRTDVPRLLQSADLLVAPARYEPYGLAVHEAICCHTPAIASRISGVAERFPAELSDLLIDDVEDVDEIVERLRAWRDRIEGYRTLVAPFGETLRRHTWDDMAAEFSELVDRGIDPARPRASANFAMIRPVRGSLP